MKALIAGAGIAGLATGIALRQAGLEVEVFERSHELREIGAGLMIWPNGARSLQALGVESTALAVQQISLCSWRGRELIKYPIQAISERFGSDVAFVHRADLQMALARSFGGDRLHLGVGVRAFKEGHAEVQVIMDDGTVASGDLLVGADGLRSPVRRQLLEDGDPFYLGSTIWRGILDSGSMPLSQGAGVDWFGRGSEFVAFHLTGDRIYWAGVTKEPQGEKPGPGGHKTDLIQRSAAGSSRYLH